MTTRSKTTAKPVTMKYFRLIYANGTERLLSAPSTLALIRQYDLATREHVTATIIQLADKPAELQ